jgi:hypothetical protein
LLIPLKKELRTAQVTQQNPTTKKSNDTRWKTIVAASVLSCERLGGFYRAEEALEHKAFMATYPRPITKETTHET